MWLGRGRASRRKSLQSHPSERHMPALRHPVIIEARHSRSSTPNGVCILSAAQARRAAEASLQTRQRRWCALLAVGSGRALKASDMTALVHKGASNTLVARWHACIGCDCPGPARQAVLRGGSSNRRVAPGTTRNRLRGPSRTVESGIAGARAELAALVSRVGGVALDARDARGRERVVDIVIFARS